MEYFSLHIQIIFLLLRRESDVSSPLFLLTERKCIILLRNLDSFDTRVNKLLNAGVFVVYVIHIYFIGAGQVFVILYGQSRAS